MPYFLSRLIQENKEGNNGKIYRRIIYNYTDGYRTGMDTIYFNGSEQETDEDGFVIVP